MQEQKKKIHKRIKYVEKKNNKKNNFQIAKRPSVCKKKAMMTKCQAEHEKTRDTKYRQATKT